MAEVSTAAVQNTVAAPDNIVTISEDRLNDLIRAVVVAATAQQEEQEPSVDLDDSPDQPDDNMPRLPNTSSALASSIIKRLR